MLKSIGASPNKAKHKIMTNGMRQQLHRVNLNTQKPTLSKKERAKIKAAVFQCEHVQKNNTNSILYKKLFDSTMGRVNTLNRMHPIMGEQLRERLQKIKPENI